MKKLKNQIKIFGLTILFVSGLCNFMWLNHNEPKWPGSMTMMTGRTYRINSNFRAVAGNSFLNPDNARQALQEAANIWFNEGYANFKFIFDGNTGRNRVAGLPNAIEINKFCDYPELVAAFRNQEKAVFAQSDLSDADLPTPAPGKGFVLAQNFSWVCKSEYIHFDIRFNDRDKFWTRQEILEVATHEFGHSLGLSHCGTNETSQECAIRQPGTDPVAGMMMNKIYITGTNKLHPDDIAGIRALYGVRGAIPFAGNLIAIKKSVTGTNSTEVHIVRGTANYQEYSLETGTILHETGAEFEFAVWDMNRDGIMDIVGIKKAVTGTNSTEVHVLNGATNFQTYLLQTGTALHETRSDANWKFAVWDYDGNGSMDLVAIVKHGGSGNTEVHVLNGSDNFKTFLLSTVTALEANADSYDFSVWDYNNDGKMDLVAVKKNMTGAGRTEVHILDGASNFSTFRLHAVTHIEENTSNYEFIPTYYPVRGSAMNIVAVKKFNTGSLSTELHVLNGATDFGTYIVNSATILVETGSNFDMDFWL
jgi:hypothetical protein